MTVQRQVHLSGAREYLLNPCGTGFKLNTPLSPTHPKLYICPGPSRLSVQEAQKWAQSNGCYRKLTFSKILIFKKYLLRECDHTDPPNIVPSLFAGKKKTWETFICHHKHKITLRRTSPQRDKYVLLTHQPTHRHTQTHTRQEKNKRGKQFNCYVRTILGYNLLPHQFCSQ